MTTPARPRWPPRADILGTPISMTSYDEVLELIDRRPAERVSRFAFCTVHGVMESRRDLELAAAHERFDVTATDGMPLVWAVRALHNPRQTRVYGPDAMRLALPYGSARGWRHFFYGSTEDTLAALRAAAERLAPGVQIAGTHAPPFRPLTVSERRDVIARISDAGTDLLWVGLGLPKQEKFVASLADDELPGVAALAVGAAFDLVSGRVPTAPGWMQRTGLEWLYRLAREPRRLWRRYLTYNPQYAVLVTGQILAERIGRNRRR